MGNNARTTWQIGKHYNILSGLAGFRSQHWRDHGVHPTGNDLTESEDHRLAPVPLHQRAHPIYQESDFVRRRGYLFHGCKRTNARPTQRRTEAPLFNMHGGRHRSVLRRRGPIDVPPRKEPHRLHVYNAWHHPMPTSRRALGDPRWYSIGSCGLLVGIRYHGAFPWCNRKPRHNTTKAFHNA